MLSARRERARDTFDTDIRSEIRREMSVSLCTSELKLSEPYDDLALLKTMQGFLVCCQDTVANLRAEITYLKTQVRDSSEKLISTKVSHQDEMETLRLRLYHMLRSAAQKDSMKGATTSELCNQLEYDFSSLERRADHSDAEIEELNSMYQSSVERLDKLRKDNLSNLELEKCNELLKQHLENANTELKLLRDQNKSLTQKLKVERDTAHQEISRLHKKSCEFNATREAYVTEAHASSEKAIQSAVDARKNAECRAASLQTQLQALESEHRVYETQLAVAAEKERELRAEVLKLEQRLVEANKLNEEHKSAILRKDERIGQIQRHHNLLDQVSLSVQELRAGRHNARSSKGCGNYHSKH